MASPYQALAPSSHSSTRPDFTPNLPSKRAEKSTIGKHLQTPDFSQSFDIKQLRKRLSRKYFLWTSAVDRFPTNKQISSWEIFKRFLCLYGKQFVQRGEIFWIRNKAICWMLSSVRQSMIVCRGWVSKRGKYLTGRLTNIVDKFCRKHWCARPRKYCRQMPTNIVAILHMREAGCPSPLMESKWPVGVWYGINSLYGKTFISHVNRLKGHFHGWMEMPAAEVKAGPSVVSVKNPFPPPVPLIATPQPPSPFPPS